MSDIRFESPSTRRCGCTDPGCDSSVPLGVATVSPAASAALSTPSERAGKAYPGAGADTRPGGWPSRGILYTAPAFQLGYTICRPQTDGVGPENCSGVNVLAFPRRGLFVMKLPGETFVADPNIVIFQNADDTFRTSHPGGHGDDTTWIALAPSLIADTMREFDPAVAERPSHPFLSSHGPNSPRTFLLQHLAFEYASRGMEADHLLIEDVVHELVREAVMIAADAARRVPPKMRTTTLRVHIDQSEAVKAFMAQRYAQKVTLDQIAAHVHAAPCHLCRLFRRVVGVPIHRYLNRLRLREAITRLSDPRANLAGVAIDVGFASHSHFTDAFRREFGVPPSLVRTWLDHADLSEVKRTLELKTR